NSREDKSNRKSRPTANSSPSGYKSKGRETQASNRNQSARKSAPYRDKGNSTEPGRPYDREKRKPYGNDSAARRPSDRDKRKPYGNDSGSGRPYNRDNRTHDQPSSESSRPTYEKRRATARKPFRKEPEDDGLIRLNRYVANAGICSRRKA